MATVAFELFMIVFSLVSFECEVRGAFRQGPVGVSFLVSPSFVKGYIAGVLPRIEKGNVGGKRKGNYELTMRNH